MWDELTVKMITRMFGISSVVKVTDVFPVKPHYKATLKY